MLNAKLLLLMVMIFACSVGKSQNLVPNSSFEDMTSCPQNIAQVNRATGWSAALNTPDYFNSCATPACVPFVACLGVPENFAGLQNAFEGNGYVGLASVGFPSTVREIIGVQLTTPLVAGTKYYVTAFVSRGSHEITTGSSNNLGFKFSTVAFSQGAAMINNQAQYHEASIITDSTSWTRIAGSFVADSAYSFLAFGNFFDDAHTDTADMSPNPPNTGNTAYYFVDNICVSDDSLDCFVINAVSTIDNNNATNLFPNPFNEELNFTTTEEGTLEFFVYDVLSKKIFQQKFSNSITVDTRQFAKGVYFYQVKNKSGVFSEGKILKD